MGRRLLQNQQALPEQQQEDQHDDKKGRLEQSPRKGKPFALPCRESKQHARGESYRHQQSDKTDNKH